MLEIILITLSIITVIFLVTGCFEDTAMQPPPKLVSGTILKSLFSETQDKVFTPRSNRPGCNGTTNNQANLLFRKGEANHNFVGIPILLFSGMTRVIPDSNLKSLLIKILKGEVSPRVPLDSTFL